MLELKHPVFFIYARRYIIVDFKVIKFCIRVFKFFKKNKVVKLYIRYFLFFFKKNKNSRMGKGIGEYRKKYVFLYRNDIFLRIKNISYCRVYKFLVYLRLKLGRRNFGVLVVACIFYYCFCFIGKYEKETYIFFYLLFYYT